MATPGLGTAGHRGSQGADRHSPCSSGMRDLLSGTKKIPARSGKTQLSTLLARDARYVNRIHLSEGLEGAWFSWLGQNGRYRDKPGAVPGHGAHCVPPSLPSARAGGGPKPTSGPPPHRLAPPSRLSPAGPASALRWPAGAWPGPAAQVLASTRVPAPARPSPLALASGRRPAPRSRQAPPRARSPARRAQPGAPPASWWQVLLGRAGVTPTRTGVPQPLPRNPGRRLQEATGWTIVWELSWSGLAAAGRLKGVHSDGSLCRCCHRAAVAAATAGCVCARVCLCPGESDGGEG